jgi:hypothetical protein
MRSSFRKKRVESCCKNEAQRLERLTRTLMHFGEYQRPLGYFSVNDLFPFLLLNQKTPEVAFETSGWSPVARTKPGGLSDNCSI